MTALPRAASTGDRADSGDRIELRGLRVSGTHGVLAEEKTRPQPFEIDLDLSVDLAVAAVSDDLPDTVDYGAVAERVVEIVAGPFSFDLLEAMAGAIAEAALASDLRVTAVTVHLRKLEPPIDADIGSVGVRITRRP